MPIEDAAWDLTFKPQRTAYKYFGHRNCLARTVHMYINVRVYASVCHDTAVVKSPLFVGGPKFGRDSEPQQQGHSPWTV